MKLTGSSVKNIILSDRLAETGICKNVRKKYQALLRGIYEPSRKSWEKIKQYLYTSQKDRNKGEKKNQTKKIIMIKRQKNFQKISIRITPKKIYLEPFILLK